MNQRYGVVVAPVNHIKPKSLENVFKVCGTIESMSFLEEDGKKIQCQIFYTTPGAANKAVKEFDGQTFIGKVVTVIRYDDICKLEDIKKSVDQPPKNKETSKNPIKKPPLQTQKDTVSKIGTTQATFYKKEETNKNSETQKEETSQNSSEQKDSAIKNEEKKKENKIDITRDFQKNDEMTYLKKYEMNLNQKEKKNSETSQKDKSDKKSSSSSSSSDYSSSSSSDYSSDSSSDSKKKKSRHHHHHKKHHKKSSHRPHHPHHRRHHHSSSRH